MHIDFYYCSSQAFINVLGDLCNVKVGQHVKSIESLWILLISSLFPLRASVPHYPCSWMNEWSWEWNKHVF